jgi:hypothetical protein
MCRRISSYTLETITLSKTTSAGKGPLVLGSSVRWRTLVYISPGVDLLNTWLQLCGYYMVVHAASGGAAIEYYIMCASVGRVLLDMAGLLHGYRFYYYVSALGVGVGVAQGRRGGVLLAVRWCSGGIL